jgi:GTP-binding protein EngB required for normal cell division
MAGAKKLLGKGVSLDTRLAGLEEAVAAARGRLDDSIVDPAALVVERAGARLRLSADHTVVALAGATGSGKSSTFNALTGLDLSAVGVRRPTTSYATACVWGDDPASELLEWLEIPPRHRVVRESMLDRERADHELDGLVLLDLPDHDSTEVSHHLEVERLIGLTDLMVWVLDPQKYADLAIHKRFLEPLSIHRDVMLVVLNHIDEVAADKRESMLADVRRLLDDDGLPRVPLLATSARTGDGIADLRAAIAKRVAAKAAIRDRLAADISGIVARLSAANGDATPPEVGPKDRRELVDALADSAGVPIVVEAVQRAATLRARQATGWPLTAWISRLRPDPLRRLHLDRGTRTRDLVAAARSSMPPADYVQKARVETAVRSVSDKVSTGLTEPWVRAVRRASTSGLPDLDDSLDRAVGSTELGVSGTPGWCRLVRAVQWVLLLGAVVGGAWLAALAVMGYLQMPAPETPDYAGFPVPTLLLLLGVVAGVVLALLSRVLIAVGSRARSRTAERRLREAVSLVCEELVVEPMTAELAAYRTTWEGLRTARS